MYNTYFLRICVTNSLEKQELEQRRKGGWRDGEKH